MHILRLVGGRQTDWFIDSCKKRRLVFLINSMAAFSFARGFLFCRRLSLLPAAFSFAVSTSLFLPLLTENTLRLQSDIPPNNTASEAPRSKHGISFRAAGGSPEYYRIYKNRFLLPPSDTRPGCPAEPPPSQPSPTWRKEAPHNLS